MNIISSRTDLETWVDNHGSFSAEERAQLVEVLREGPAPMWGADWTAYLEGGLEAGLHTLLEDGLPLAARRMWA